ncbi:hypothetical protein ROZALSC1DRAFT_24641 [Rozella allomycis CSF55]|uniref:Uncharacterized protein n=1 Tax=Rozella allomycis (strain CSF55) TaxID=988480 RepID=A0A4V1IZ68_ROZAC|nr:hypothetical protein ROZALSC1DRAFT_24641 [Rozella allomycis CSF55]
MQSKKATINRNVCGIWYDESPYGNGIGVNVDNYIIYPEDCTYVFKRKTQIGLDNHEFVQRLQLLAQFLFYCYTMGTRYSFALEIATRTLERGCIIIDLDSRTIPCAVYIANEQLSLK